MRRWVAGLLLGVMVASKASAESFDALVNEYLALVRQAEVANAPEMLLTSEAMRKVARLTDRSDLLKLEISDLESVCIRKYQVLEQIMNFGLKASPLPDPQLHQKNGERFVKLVVRFGADLARCTTRQLDISSKTLSVKTKNELTFQQQLGVMNMSYGAMRILDGNMEVFSLPNIGAEELAIHVAMLVEVMPSLVGNVKPAVRKRWLPALQVARRKVASDLQPQLDKLQAQIERADCEGLCALLQ